MTVQQLKHFLSVCEELNYTRAAEKCYISRQALRQNIASLEQELKTSLFFMEANKIQLTDMGELLKQRAASVVKAFSELEKEMTIGAGRQIIRLGVSLSLIPDYLPTLEENLRSFGERNPNVHIEVFRMKNDELADAVIDDSLDCALAMDLNCEVDNLFRHQLSSHPCAVLLSHNNPLSKYSSLTLSQLAGQTLCLPGTGSFMQPLTNALQEKSGSPELRVVESYYQVYYMVREQNCIAVNRYIPSEAGDMYASNIVLEDVPPICCSLFYPKNRENGTVARLGRFLQRELKSYFDSIGGSET